MGSVWVCSFPSCTTYLCRHCNLSSTRLLQPSTSVSLLRVRASQTTTTPAAAARTRTRKSRRIKSDAEICNDIHEFLASVGLPVDHIPSTKELLQHGWNDLAKIVRRRGHKQIQEILTRNSLNADVEFLSAETSLDERLDATNDFQDPLTGQNDKVDSVVDDVEASAEILLGSSSGSLYVDTSSSLGEGTNSAEEASANLFVEDGLREVKDQNEKVDSVVDDVEASAEFLQGSSSGSLYVDSSSSLGEGTNSAEEASANLFVEDGLREVKDHAEVVDNVTGENFYPTEVVIADSDYDSTREDLYSHFSSQVSFIPTEISGELPFQTVSSGNSESEDSLVSKTVGETLSLTENLSNTSFNESNPDTEDKEFSHVEPLVGFPLEQKDLGALEGLDDSNDDVAEDVGTTSEVSIREHLSGDERLDSVVYSADTDSSSTNVDTLAKSLKERVANFIQSGELDLFEGTHLPEDNNVMAHGNSLTSKQVVPSGALDLDPPLWDDHWPQEDLTTHSNKDVDTEASKVQNEDEINQLKFMLYQKEVELSRLKEQIEKEKVALSILQTKAEAEISKARKLISEKDAELDVAEESLSGLKEVQVAFCGDGDVVEVAGSFNGWHHRIKLDPQQSTSTMDLNASRSSRCWSTMLWLYPGVYEIKFVVDGKWQTDPQRESVTRGHICNNVLRVR